MDTVSASVARHEAVLKEMGLPSLLEYEPNSYTHGNPRVQRLELQAIRRDLQALLASTPTATMAARITRLLATEVGEKLFITSQMIDNQTRALETLSANSVSEETAPDRVAAPAASEDLQLLRRRLLSGGKSQLDEAQVSQYHELVQLELITELADLTSSLKLGAVSLSQKILGDEALLLETSDNLAKNSTLLRQVDRSLNLYLERKTGGKVGYIYMVKTAIAVLFVVIAALIMVAIVPKF